MRPVTMKATCQPHVSDSQTTRGGAIIAPTELPVLNQPVPIERSLGGNQLVEILTPEGIGAASPMPSRARNAAMDCQLPARAWSAQAVPQVRAKRKYPNLSPMRSVMKPAMGCIKL